MSSAPPWRNGLPWTLSTESGRAADLHRDSADRVAAQAGPLGRAAVVLDVVAPAVVLGSTEPADHLDAGAVAAAGIDVVRRRSGGSAVIVGPQRCLWVDLVIGRNDPLWHDDVGRAAWWVGDLWTAALSRVGVDGAASWHNGLRRSTFSDRVCFAGLGPGEITVEGRKVVGVAQRRTRAGALFQCAALLSSRSLGAGVAPATDGLSELVGLQSLELGERSVMQRELTANTFSLSPNQGEHLLSALQSLLGGA